MSWFEKRDPDIDYYMDWESFRAPGETFEYLGITMCVVRFGKPEGENRPKMFCRYVDNHGNLHSYSFPHYELETLRKMNHAKEI